MKLFSTDNIDNVNNNNNNVDNRNVSGGGMIIIIEV